MAFRPRFRCRSCGDMTDWIDRTYGMADVCIWCATGPLRSEPVQGFGTGRPTVTAAEPRQDPATVRDRCKACGITKDFCGALIQSRDKRCCRRCTHA